MGTATTDIDNIVLLYPYSNSYKLNAANSSVDVYIPSTQYYEEGSYGVGANLMASVETDDNFILKSLCGWIVVQLKGDATITSITLSGNNGEQLAGDADFDYAKFNLNLIYYPTGSNIYGDSNVGGSLVWGDCIESITLDCGDGIVLNPDKPTEFYFVVPPQKFTNGITIEAECLRGEPIVKSSSKALTVQRNHIVPMSTITANEVIPNNQIWYTSTDGEVVEIDSEAFVDINIVSNICENGQGVITFDRDITTIGYCAFYGCDSLTGITIPDSVTTIEAYAFCECYALESFTVPESVTTIESGAFISCKSLSSFSGRFASEDGRCLIDGDTLLAVAPAGLTEYTIPDGITTIGFYAFNYCQDLENVIIPNSVKKIDFVAFSCCSNLVDITIPESVTIIGVYAFEDCDSLDSITIPTSVQQIGAGAFWHCDNLDSVYCKRTTPPTADYKADYQDWGAFDDNAQNRKIYVPAESVEAYKSADGWSDYADSIIGYDFEKGEIFAKQKLVYTATSIVSLNSTDFGDANILYNKFDATTGVGVIGFDREVTTIEDEAFAECYNLTSITIPESVTKIGVRAFYYCSSLRSITIPKSVTSIGPEAFQYCTGELTINCNIPSVSNTYSDRRAFYGSKFTKVTIGDDVTTIGDYAFDKCSDLTSITIGNKVTTIGGCAFCSCSNLTEITIPESVTTIGNNAFDSCENLTNVTILNGITTIEWGTFSNCTSLKSIIIPENVTSIKAYAFSACSSLTNVTIGDNVTEIENGAFYNCRSLASVTIPDSVTTIGDDAFYNCSSLASVTIGDSVTTIGNYAFYNCSSLTSVYCKAVTPPTGNDSMFDNNAYGRKIYVPTASVEVYKLNWYWSDYVDYIVGYNF